MIGIALFGLGRAGKIHAKNILANPNCCLIFVIEPRREAINEFRSTIPPHLGDIRYIKSSDDRALDVVFDNDLVSAVFVCSTTGTHYSIIKRALESGKAVFCEKPVSLDAKQTEALYRIAFDKKIPLHCSFNRRYDPQVRELYASLRCGGFGNVHLLKTCSRDHPCPPIDFLRDSGGFFHDCASHDLDMICWLLNAMPERVFASASVHSEAIRDLGDIDTAVIVLNFPPLSPTHPGTIGLIDISRHGCYGYDQRVEILTDNAMIRSDNQQAPGILINAPEITKSAPIKDSFPQRYYESYVKSLECFVEAIQSGKQADITACDVVNISHLAHLCEESFKLGRPLSFKPIKLDF